MPFLRQLYKQKPQAWGSVSAVQSSLFHNLESIGIDHQTCALALPLWELSGVPHDYVSGSTGLFYGSVVWTDRGINTTGNTGYIAFPLIPKKHFLTDFTVSMHVKLGTMNTVSSTSFSNIATANSGFECTFEEYSNTGKYGVTLNGVANQATTLSHTIGKDVFLSWRMQNGVAIWVNENQQQVTQASGTQNSSSVIDGIVLGAKNRGSIGSKSNADYYACYGFNKILKDSQVRLLSDNPYFLMNRVPPVFYSVPGGAGGVTISSTTGTVVVTGYDVGIETGVTISVNTGIITGTGFNVEVEQGTSIKATTGEISINGLNPDIVQGIQFIVTKGMVTINSFDTTVLNGTEINVTSKNVSITGYAVEVEQGIIITSSIESIIITGYNVSVTNELVINLNVGSVIIAGYNTTVLAGMKIDLTKAEITITGLDLEIEQGTQIDVTSETVTVTGLDVSVENALSINVTTGSVNVLGYPVSVYAGILVKATTGNVAITGYNPTVAQSSGVEVTTGQVTIIGLDTTIECTVLIEPTTGMVIIASYAVTVTDGLVAETPITRTNIVAASNRVITNSGSSRLIVIT